MILLVTSKDDLTSDYLIKRINDRGVEFFRFNTEDFPTFFDVSLFLDKEGSDFTIRDRVRQSTISASEVSSAYFRKPRKPTIEGEADIEEQIFHEREMVETLRSLWRLMPREKWLNSPESLFLASSKVKQLTIAKEIGFQIPETLISSRPGDILAFAEKHGNDLIAKAVKNGFLVSSESANLIFTGRVEASDYASIKHSQTVVPSTLQPRLNKQCDLRITVIGDCVFAAAILSQEHETTSVDWRTWGTVSNVNLIQERFTLPQSVAEMCRELNRRLDLEFSCIDMVQTTDDEFVFLEVNANGQWAWIEEMVGFPVRDAIIDRLLLKARL